MTKETELERGADFLGGSDSPENGSQLSTDPASWWSLGEILDPGRAGLLAPGAVGCTLNDEQLLIGRTSDEVWDVSDSLLELYEMSQRQANNHALLMKQRQNPKLSQVNVQEWLDRHSSHGFVRVYAASSTEKFDNWQRVPCSTATSGHKICLMLGISLNALHVQLNGDVIRRLDPDELPLDMQNTLLNTLGHTDRSLVQQLGDTEQIGYMIRFYAGKPFHDSTFARNHLQSYLDVKRGKMMGNWTRKLCVLSATRLLIYKDKMKHHPPSVFQLARGTVEEVPGRDLCLRLTMHGGQVSLFLGFADRHDFDRWYTKCRKATSKLPTTADLSSCHLEFLPDAIFANEELRCLNLRHNVLKERPIEEDIYTIGWIDDLPKFTCLRSLNLADNNLVHFPLAICTIQTLVELNLASNQLSDIPSEIISLNNLEILHIHNNKLDTLPEQMCSLRKLCVFVLAFNQFLEVPTIAAHLTDVRISDLQNLILAGNQIEHLTSKLVQLMKYVKKLDLRMNCLSLPHEETLSFSSLEHLTHLDIRDNAVEELDVRPLNTLEYLNCERNGMTSLMVNGQALKNLFASHNYLEILQIQPKPEWLLQMDLSHNDLLRLPDWISDCFFLQKLNFSHNRIVSLPQRLFLETKKLKSLRANHNKILCLPDECSQIFIEELFLHHNALSFLPPTLLKLSNKLRILNISWNRLACLPDLHESTDLNRVQELYASGNLLTDSVFEVIAGYRRLRILHISHNEIQAIDSQCIEHLQWLQEINVSGNQLRELPSAIGRLPRLTSVWAHSNLLTSLPELKDAQALRVLDIGNNLLHGLSVTHLMDSQLSLLDMSLNSDLKADPSELQSLRSSKPILLIDRTGQNRTFPGLDRESVEPRSLVQSAEEIVPGTPWKIGCSETSGMRNKLCVSTLRKAQFGTGDQAVFGMFDGGHNDEIVKFLLKEIIFILEEEMKKHRQPTTYMKYTLLSAHRKLQALGQRLGASAVLAHLERTDGYYNLHLANVGDTETVLCRRGHSLLLTHPHTTSADAHEKRRIYQAGGIITEDNKVSGVTKCTRQLGTSYLYPFVLPDPYTTSVALRSEDEFFIIANRGLFKYVSYAEAVEEIYDIGNPIVAAKQLQDLAQAFGSKENIGILVVRLNTDSNPSLHKLRLPRRSMSIDDLQVAEDLRRMEQNSKEHSSVERKESGLSSSGKSLGTAIRATYNVDNENTQPSSDLDMVNDGRSDDTEKGADSGADDRNVNINANDDCDMDDDKDVEIFHEDGSRDSPNFPLDSPPLRPLPKQRFRKKNAASEWEAVLQKRLTSDVKDKEMQSLASEVRSDETLTSENVNDIFDQSSVSPISDSLSPSPPPDLLRGSLMSEGASPSVVFSAASKHDSTECLSNSSLSNSSSNPTVPLESFYGPKSSLPAENISSLRSAQKQANRGLERQKYPLMTVNSYRSESSSNNNSCSPSPPLLGMHCKPILKSPAPESFHPIKVRAPSPVPVMAAKQPGPTKKSQVLSSVAALKLKESTLQNSRSPSPVALPKMSSQGAVSPALPPSSRIFLASPQRQRNLSPSSNFEAHRKGANSSISQPDVDRRQRAPSPFRIVMRDRLPSSSTSSSVSSTSVSPIYPEPPLNVGASFRHSMYVTSQNNLQSAPATCAKVCGIKGRIAMFEKMESNGDNKSSFHGRKSLSDCEPLSEARLDVMKNTQQKLPKVIRTDERTPFSVSPVQSRGSRGTTFTSIKTKNNVTTVTIADDQDQKVTGSDDTVFLEVSQL